MQLKVESPYVFEKENKGNLWKGFDGIKFGIKYRFMDAESFGMNISSYPQIQIPLKLKKLRIFLTYRMEQGMVTFWIDR